MNSLIHITPNTLVGTLCVVQLTLSQTRSQRSSSSRKFNTHAHMFRLATAALSLIPAMQPLRAGVAMPARALASRAAEKTGPIFDVVFCAN